MFEDVHKLTSCQDGQSCPRTVPCLHPVASPNRGRFTSRTSATCCHLRPVYRPGIAVRFPIGKLPFQMYVPTQVPAGVAALVFAMVACHLLATCSARPTPDDSGESGIVQLRKRPFLEANCRGSYAPHFDSFVHRLDRVCRECADMFPSMRDFIQDGCQSECYRNEVFRDCLSASMVNAEEVNQMVGELSGKK